MDKVYISKTEAAYLILNEYNKPLRVSDIIAIALDRGMIKVVGRTPESTLASDLLQENQRRKLQGRKTRFVKVGPGLWTLIK